MRIFGWAADAGGCNYYRVAMPLWALQNHGHETAWGQIMPPAVLRGEADVIIAQRTCEPGTSATWQRLAREGHARLIFELDDDFWHLDPTNRPATLFFTEERKRRLIENITVADLVTVSTEPLADVVSEWNPNITVLENCIPARLLEHERIHQDHTVIGWGGGTSHRTDFGEIAAPLRRVLQRFGDRVEAHVVGEDFTDRLTSRRGRTRFTPWLPVEEWYRAIDFDIGVIPLKATRFNESKSDVKLLELAALGIPAVVSYVGPYRRALDAGAPALPATDHRSFEDAMTSLVTDEALRTALGKQAHDWATGRTIEANTHLWEKAYAG